MKKEWRFIQDGCEDVGRSSNKIEHVVDIAIDANFPEDPFKRFTTLRFLLGKSKIQRKPAVAHCHACRQHWSTICLVIPPWPTAGRPERSTNFTTEVVCYATQQHLLAATGTSFKRTHIYELLAASFGFNSYAALGADNIFTQNSLTNRHPAKYSEQVGRRCLELGYPAETALQVAPALVELLTMQSWLNLRGPLLFGL